MGHASPSIRYSRGIHDAPWIPRRIHIASSPSIGDSQACITPPWIHNHRVSPIIDLFSAEFFPRGRHADSVPPPREGIRSDHLIAASQVIDFSGVPPSKCDVIWVWSHFDHLITHWSSDLSVIRVWSQALLDSSAFSGFWSDDHFFFEFWRGGVYQ